MNKLSITGLTSGKFHALRVFSPLPTMHYFACQGCTEKNVAHTPQHVIPGSKKAPLCMAVPFSCFLC